VTDTIDLIAAGRALKPGTARCARSARPPVACAHLRLSSMNLPAVDAVQRWLRITDQRCSGVRAIGASRIVGAVDQGNDLDRDFTGDGS
jgi:hypothetical protein